MQLSSGYFCTPKEETHSRATRKNFTAKRNLSQLDVTLSDMHLRPAYHFTAFNNDHTLALQALEAGLYHQHASASAQRALLKQAGQASGRHMLRFPFPLRRSAFRSASTASFPLSPSGLQALQFVFTLPNTTPQHTLLHVCTTNTTRAHARLPHQRHHPVLLHPSRPASLQPRTITNAYARSRDSYSGIMWKKNLGYETG